MSIPRVHKKTCPAGQAWRHTRETGRAILSSVLPAENYLNTETRLAMLPKNKISVAAFAIAWLSIIACTLTEGANAAILTPSPTSWVPKATPSPTSQSLSCHVKTYVDKGQINLRAGPGTEFAVIVVLHEGDPINALVSANNWIKAKINNRVGWINSHYIECNNSNGGER